MIWPAADRWRAPVRDWPPPWASSWGSDRYGLWADLVVGGVAQRFRWIEPSGVEWFWIGDPGKQSHQVIDASFWRLGRSARSRRGSKQLHQIIEVGFWLADTPCTQAFWVQVAEGQANPSQFQQGDETGQRPVERVSWDDVQQWLVRLVRLCPATVGLAALPTEVQWEYACRAGTTTAYWWGYEFDSTRANADVQGDRDLDGSKGATTSVKHFPPNPWGLHDMHGNVLEWCGDVWRERLDEVGEAAGEDGSSVRAVRGGSWIGRPGNARSTYRDGGARGLRSQDLGFRLALRSPSPGPEAFGPEGRAR